MLTVISIAGFLKEITLAIENSKNVATFLNIDGLNLAGAINRSVGSCDGLFIARTHTTVGVNRSDLTMLAKQDVATTVDNKRESDHHPW